MKLGIDLGTTNTLAAFYEEGRGRFVPNQRGRHATPSVVGCDNDGTILVGESARNQLIGAPNRTVVAVKRMMGKRMTVPLGSTAYSPEEVSAEILRSVRRNAAEYIGTAINECVITVPAHFDDRQRGATVEAGLLAGFHHVSLLNEPTAAALPYAVRSRNHERIVVFDFGGGTLDVSCLEREGSDYIVQSTLGDGELGGADIDRLLYQRFQSELARDGDAPFDNDPVVVAALTHLAEQAKIDLSERESTTVTFPFAMTKRGGDHLTFTVTREELEALMQPLIDRAYAVTAQAVREAGFHRRGFDTLVLAGGSSRLPIVRRVIGDAYEATIAHRINPEEVIAAGAALYAEGEIRRKLRIRDALSHTLSIELSDGSCVPVIRKNQSIPTSRTRIFTTVSDGQAEAEIHLLQGDDRNAGLNRSLGRFTLSNIESAPQGRARIAVTVSVDADGLVTLRAGDKATGVQRQITTRPRSEAARSDIQGGLQRYIGSLVRRLETLSHRADGPLRLEMEQIVSVIGEQRGVAADDMLTVLETLILEAVAEHSDGDAQGDSRAAS